MSMKTSNGFSAPDIKKRRVSSGLHELDTLLGDLYIGDNVLWYDDMGSFSAAFSHCFIRETLAQKKPLIYVTFDRSPKNVVSFLGTLAESQNLTILDCFTNGKGDSSEVFNKFYEKDGALWPYKVIKVNNPTSAAHVAEAMYGVHSNLAGDVHFIIDSLTGMQSLWGGEEQVIEFYVKTCPRLYELDTIAYWLVEKGAHSSRLKANINKIAQVVIDLSVRRGNAALKILKAEKRSSQYINEHHCYSCEGSTIIFESQRSEKNRFDLGARIKSTRLMRGLSQKELAALTGVTPSTISQVEKNLIYPSLPALFRIGESLSVEVATLLKDTDRDRDSLVYASTSRSSISLAKSLKGQVSGELLLPPDLGAPVDVTLLRVLPGKKIAGHFFAHKGREMGYLITGQVEMIMDNQIYQMNAGDMVYLEKDMPSGWRNLSEQSAELLWLTFKQ